MTALTGGEHTLVLGYQTINSRHHAIDYLGSFDATETTSSTPTPLHANNNNPCFDILGSGAGSGCTALGTPPTPASTFPVPDANLAAQKTACGASGLDKTPTQVPGKFSLFAPDAAGAKLTDSDYVSQNVGTGTECLTTMSVKFHLDTPAPNGGWTVVLAFGGRIASALDWGAGNSAGAISGSPYHMELFSLDGAATGNQDVSLSTSSVAPAPTPVTTQVSNTNITLGSKLTDTVTATGVNQAPPQGGPPTGKVQFQLCSDTTTGCPQGTGVNLGSPVDLARVGTTNNSSATFAFGSRLGPGNYCVGVVYANDGNSFYSSTYAGSATNECFTVVGPPVFAAYYDTERFHGTKPSPWEGDPNVIFVGCDNQHPSDCPLREGDVLYDTGALRLDNPTGQAMTVTDASVTVGPCSYQPWPGLDVQVPAHEMLILTQTHLGHSCSPTTVPTNFNFDTTDSHTLSTPCTPNGFLPVFDVTVDGHSLVYTDTQQILNAGGIDPDQCSRGANESHGWAAQPLTRRARS